jgi:hypothetical protein
MDIISLPHTFAAEVQLFCFPFSSTNMIAPGCLATPRLALGMLMGRKSTAKPSPESWSYRAVGIVLTATSHRYHPSSYHLEANVWSHLHVDPCWTTVFIGVRKLSPIINLPFGDGLHLWWTYRVSKHCHSLRQALPERPGPCPKIRQWPGGKSARWGFNG